MRISDWSSDVCSSDLPRAHSRLQARRLWLYSPDDFEPLSKAARLRGNAFKEERPMSSSYSRGAGRRDKRVLLAAAVIAGSTAFAGSAAADSGNISMQDRKSSRLNSSH